MDIKSINRTIQARYASEARVEQIAEQALLSHGLLGDFSCPEDWNERFENAVADATARHSLTDTQAGFLRDCLRDRAEPSK